MMMIRIKKQEVYVVSEHTTYIKLTFDDDFFSVNVPTSFQHQDECYGCTKKLVKNEGTVLVVVHHFIIYFLNLLLQLQPHACNNNSLGSIPP